MSPETSVALASAAVALCALFVSLWQISVQRTHNKLSVQPFLHSDRYSRDHGVYKWQLVNAGAGPAIVKSFSITIGKDKLLFPSVDIFVGVLKTKGISGPVSTCTHKFGDYILTGQSHALLEISPNLAGEFSNILSSIIWEIEYESIYGDKHTFTFPAEGNS